MGVRPRRRRSKGRQPGWPLDKSLCGIPTLFAWSLAYGRNLLRQPLSASELLEEAERLAAAEPEIEVADLLCRLRALLASPAAVRGPALEFDPWRIRTLKPWIRTNPPVGAVADKDRPATSYIVVATLERDRYFDLDGVSRTPLDDSDRRHSNGTKPDARDGTPPYAKRIGSGSSGAPPLDWWNPVDAVVDEALAEHRQGVRGWHIRRALERAGLLRTAEALDVSPKGYKRDHFAVWPKELVRLLVEEMCPRRVCAVCGKPSRRLVRAAPSPHTGLPGVAGRRRGGRAKGPLGLGKTGIAHGNEHRRAETIGWSHCGCGEGCRATTWRKVRVPVVDENGRCQFTLYGRPVTKTILEVEDPGQCVDATHWRPGLVLDPFVGSGTTLEVCTGMDRDALGIDLDERNEDRVRDRVGMFLADVDPPPGRPQLTA